MRAAELLELVPVQERAERPEPSWEERLNRACGFVYPWRQIRLPRQVRPERYRLFLHPNLTRLDLRGELSLEVRVLNETGLLVLHQAGLNLSSVALYVDAQKVDCRWVSAFGRSAAVGRSFWLISRA